MKYLEAYHLGAPMTEADKQDRIRLDKTCFACGHYDGDNYTHDCPGYPD